MCNDPYTKVTYEIYLSQYYWGHTSN